MGACRQRRWLYRLGLKVLVCLCLCAGIRAGAHPIEYHMQPLSDLQIRRAVLSLEKIASQLGDSSAVELPAGAMGVSAALWTLWDALEATAETGDPLPELLVTAGYKPSSFIVEEWEIEVDRVLVAYEVLRRGLDPEAVQKAYKNLEEERAGLDEQTLGARERALLRDGRMVRTSYVDLEGVSGYRARIDRLFGKVQLEPRP